MRSTQWLAPIHSGRITAMEDDGSLVIRVPASITVTNAAMIRSGVLAAWQEGGKLRKLILDLSAAAHIDSSGIGTLIEFSHKASADRLPLLLCGLQTSPLRILERTGLIEWFTIHATVEQALGRLVAPHVGAVEPGVPARGGDDQIRYRRPFQARVVTAARAY